MPVLSSDMKNTPLVTIACLTYNQCQFIRQTLDSFVSQKVDFPIEIIVHDDASTDGTQEILKEYKEKYPELFTLILQDENMYSRGWTKIFEHGVFRYAKGKYIATCEGDDYWTDEYKLQKQADFLEANPDYNFSVGKVVIKNEFTGKIEPRQEQFDITKQEYYTLRDYLKFFFSQTSTYFFRREGYETPDYCNRFHGEDILMVVLGTRDGKIKYHNEDFSVYRVHQGGVTQKNYKWRLHYLDIMLYTESLQEILEHQYPLIFKSIKWRLYFDYKMKVINNKSFKVPFYILSKINDFVRWKLL